MSFPRTLPLLAVLILAAAAPAADLKTAKGDAIKGDLVAVSDKEIVFTKGAEKLTLPLNQVLTIDFAPEAKIAPETKYSDVELTDGTLLHCKSVALKGSSVEVTFLDDRAMKLPVLAVSNILFPASDAKARKDWTERAARRRTRDVIVRKEGELINGIEGTLGEADPTGTTIAFTVASPPAKINAKIALMHGLLFFRQLDPLAPPVKCKLHDLGRNVIMVSGQTLTDDGLKVTTPAGVEFVYPLTKLARLDYSTGNIVYLSDMEPTRVKYDSTEEYVQRFRRDRNLDDTGPLRIKGEVYPKGLALHAFTELEYDLRGDYRQLSFVVGIDDNVGGLDGPVNLLIEGDGRELLKLTVSRRDKERARAFALNIKEVQKLRIVVSSGDLLDLGKHLNLADIKVSK